MASCLVLGGAGFIGSHLAEALAQEGHRVKVFDRPHVDRLLLFPRARGFEVFTGDFLNPQALAPALQGTELVFHLVSTTLPKSSNDNPVYDVESNVLGSLRLLELCREQGVRKLVFVSSGGTVYGVPRTTPVAENHPTEPISSYGIDQPIQIWGDGSVVRDYVYVADAVDAMLKAARFDGAQRIFNIGSGKGTSLNELVAGIEKLLGRPVKVEHSEPRALDVPVNVLDSSLAERYLGWRASTPLGEGLRRTCEWLRAAR